MRDAVAARSNGTHALAHLETDQRAAIIDHSSKGIDSSHLRTATEIHKVLDTDYAEDGNGRAQFGI